MKTLESLKKEVLEDGIIDSLEVKEIEKLIYADGKIDQEEADFLFDLNDAVSGNENDESWEQLFIKAITSFVLEDEHSAGEIDEDEVAYLKAKIEGDGVIDSVEKNLLLNLKEITGSLHKDLQALLN
jgi:hypothetical protein